MAKEKYVPEQIKVFVEAALAIAKDDTIGYCQWGNGKDVMCTALVSQALSKAHIPFYGNVHAAQPTNGGGWKTYPFTDDDVDKVWPGDILITQGTHAGVAVGWGGPVAEAITSGTRPAPNVGYKSYTDAKGNTYDYAVKLDGAGKKSFDLGVDDHYQVETHNNVPYESYETRGYSYYKKKTYPWTTLTEEQFNKLKPEEKANYTEVKVPPETHYRTGTLTCYKRYTEKNDFWPTPGDQGGEVIADGSVGGAGRTHIIRYIRAWLGIDHFEPNFTGKVFEIP